MKSNVIPFPLRANRESGCLYGTIRGIIFALPAAICIYVAAMWLVFFL